MQLKITLAFTLLASLLWGQASAQEHHPEELPDTVVVHNVKEMFTKGTFDGHIRNYFMATINHEELTDHYANAIGAKLGYKTAPIHGFRFGFAGLFTFNAFSSDIDEVDPIAGRHPKLELELFDLENPENKADLDRLDELYLEYKSDKLGVQLGRISFNSPLINPQDTRMKPYAVQGISVQVPVQEHSQLTLAWFDHFSPRSTVEWFSAESSIGVYSSGVDAEGEPSDYEEHTHTKGVAVAGFQTRPTKKLQAEVWNYWIDNVSDNIYSRAVLEVAPRVKIGMEGLYQYQVGNGGNAEETKAYFPDQQQWLVGSMVAYAPDSWNISANYLHIGNDGRFLFPREWGREQFFATLPRGRMEGTGNSDLLVVKVKKTWSEHLSVEWGLAKTWLPAPEDYRHNKYGAVSYLGWVADLQYKPANPVLDGLSFRFLYVGRTSPNSDLSLGNMFYNTNFHNLNLVTQITF